jgi:phosphoglycerol transferase MdoB-like AlkP superfamily enzyme
LIVKITKKLVLLNAVFLALMSVFRLVFFLYYADLSALGGLWGYVFKAFILGIRFDLVVIAYLNVFVTLSLAAVWMIGKGKIFRAWASALKYYYIAGYLFVFLILAVDFGFYSYFKNHINIIIFGVLEDDTLALLSTIAKNRYSIPAFLILAALGASIWIFISRSIEGMKTAARGPARGRKYPVWAKLVTAFLLVIANGLAARGSLKMFPLGTTDAAISPDAFINKLSLTGFFTLGEAVTARLSENEGTLDYVQMAGYEGRSRQAFADLTGRAVDINDPVASLFKTTRRNAAAERLRPNVILLVMEGFGSDLLNYQSREFDVLGGLKKHFESGYLFRNFLPGDIGTIGSLESIFLNMPKRQQAKAITQSKHAFETFPTGAALPFKRAGYETIFVYGGDIGWRNLISFAPLQGFDTADGQGAMPKDALKNEWGVYDQYLLDYIFGKLSSGGKPKFIMAMSTGNHPPYSVPGDYKPLPLKISGELDKRITGDRQLAAKRFATYQYANQKLGELLTRIKNSAYGRNTIIVITGDHNFWDVFDYGTEKLFDRFSVPLFIYVPYALRPARADTAVYGSHIDIMPTIYNLALSNAKYAAVGRDLFDNSAGHEAFISEGYVFAGEGAASVSLSRDTVEYFRWNPEGGRRIIPFQETRAMKKRVDYYKAAIAVTDYLIKNNK